MREFIRINRDWHFTGPDGSKTAVDLPHTWNAIDGQDGGNDYWRGTCLYEKDFAKPAFSADERMYLEFRGVNASARVELNGQLIGTHAVSAVYVAGRGYHPCFRLLVEPYSSGVY